MQSKFDPEAKIIEEGKGWHECPHCGSPVFASKVAVWCSKNERLEEGDCDFQLMSG